VSSLSVSSSSSSVVCSLRLADPSAEIAQRHDAPLADDFLGDFVNGSQHSADAARYGLVRHRTVGDRKMRLLDEAVAIDLEQNIIATESGSPGEIAPSSAVRATTTRAGQAAFRTSRTTECVRSSRRRLERSLVSWRTAENFRLLDSSHTRCRCSLSLPSAVDS